MPELPEVENIVQGLQELAGQTLRAVRVLNRDILRNAASFPSGATHGKRLLRILRRGKYILFSLEDDWTLVLHMGMTGQVLLRRPDSAGRDFRFPLVVNGGTVRDDGAPLPDKHTHLRVDFESHVLYFRDIRKFGFVDLVRSDEHRLDAYFSHVGRDPFELEREDAVFMLKKHKARIKPLLLSQRVVSGLGNIYADEALFRAGINPRQKASRLSQDRLGRLYDVMKQVLEDAIRNGGSSIEDYRRPDGSQGSFQRYHRVYGREGQPCPQCGCSIRKIKLGGRGTSFCPRCQK